MSLFGWNLPPGCGQLPGEEEIFCEVCGKSVDAGACICPTCPVCEEVGRPECYTAKADGGCGCVLSPEQIQSKQDEERKWREQAEAEAAWDAKATEWEKEHAEEIAQAIKPDRGLSGTT